jgi:hypothetical protein
MKSIALAVHAVLFSNGNEVAPTSANLDTILRPQCISSAAAHLKNVPD